MDIPWKTTNLGFWGHGGILTEKGKAGALHNKSAAFF